MRYRQAKSSDFECEASPKRRTQGQPIGRNERREPDHFECEGGDVAPRKVPEDRCLDARQGAAPTLKREMERIDIPGDGDRSQRCDVLPDEETGADDKLAIDRCAAVEAGLEREGKQAGEAWPAGRAFDRLQQRAKAGVEGWVVGKLFRRFSGAYGQTREDDDAACLGHFAPAVGQASHERRAVAAAAHDPRGAPPGVIADCHLGAAGETGTGGTVHEGALDHGACVGHQRCDVAGERVVADTVDRQRLGHGQERHAGAGDANPEIPVLAGAERRIEAAGVESQRAVEDAGVDRDGAFARENAVRGVREGGVELRLADHARGRGAPVAAVDETRAGAAFQGAQHALDESGRKPVVGIEELQPWPLGGCDAAVARGGDAFGGTAVA